MNYEINIKYNNYKNDNIIQKSSKFYGLLKILMKTFLLETVHGNSPWSVH